PRSANRKPGFQPMACPLLQSSTAGSARLTFEIWSSSSFREPSFARAPKSSFPKCTDGNLESARGCAHPLAETRGWRRESWEAEAECGPPDCAGQPCLQPTIRNSREREPRAQMVSAADRRDCVRHARGRGE